jgi:hypothetical protein
MGVSMKRDRLETNNDRNLNLYRFELAIDIFRREGNVTPLTKDGKIISGFDINYRIDRDSLVTFFWWLGYDPGIVTEKKVTHFKVLSDNEFERSHLTIEYKLIGIKDLEVEND